MFKIEKALNAYKNQDFIRFGEKNNDESVLVIEGTGKLIFKDKEIGEQYPNVDIICFSEDIVKIGCEEKYQNPFRGYGANIVVCSDELRESRFAEPKSEFRLSFLDTREKTFTNSVSWGNPDGKMSFPTVMTYSEFDEFLEKFGELKEKYERGEYSDRSFLLASEEEKIYELARFFLEDKYRTSDFEPYYNDYGISIAGNCSKNPEKIEVLHMPERLDSIFGDFTRGMSNLKTIVFSENTHSIFTEAGNSSMDRDSLRFASMEEKDMFAKSTMKTDVDLIVCTEELHDYLKYRTSTAVTFMNHQEYAVYQDMCKEQGERIEPSLAKIIIEQDISVDRTNEPEVMDEIGQEK